MCSYWLRTWRHTCTLHLHTPFAYAIITKTSYAFFAKITLCIFYPMTPFAHAFAYAIKKTPYAFFAKITLCMYIICDWANENLRTKRPEESIKELLFFDFEYRQGEPRAQSMHCSEWIFKGDKTRDEFCKWLFTTEHAGCTVMAHNFQGYDSNFILQYLCEQGVKYDVIMRGAKVVSFKNGVI